MLFCFVDGQIPSEFCSSGGISIDVTGSNIHCYSGCLTSSEVLVTGADEHCHDNKTLLAFVLIVCVGFVVMLAFTGMYLWDSGTASVTVDLCSSAAARLIECLQTAMVCYTV
jgi:hypothetical protein